MSGPRAELSLVTDSGCDYGGSCGYCGGSDQWYTHGMSCRNLTVYAYQDLIDQGWRRSGSYLYKPDLARSCCKAYTIRLDAHHFVPDKGQRRLMRKWREYLADAAAASTAQAPGQQAPSPPADPGPGLSGSAPMPLRADDSNMDTDRSRDGDGDRGGDGGTGSNSDSDPAVTHLQHLLSEALQAAIAGGELQPAGYPAPVIRRCTAKQRQALPADVQYTSAAAFGITAAVARSARAAAGAGPSDGRAAASAAGPDGDPAGPARVHRESGGVGGGSEGGVGVGSGSGSGGGSGGAKGTSGRGGGRGRLGGMPAAGTSGTRAAGLTADAVAAVLARRFNEVAAAVGPGASGVAAAPTGAPGVVGDGGSNLEAAGGTDSVMQEPGSSSTATPAAPSTAGPSKPEAYAASGHINIRWGGQNANAGAIRRPSKAGCSQGGGLDDAGQPSAAGPSVQGGGSGGEPGGGGAAAAVGPSRQQGKRRGPEPERTDGAGAGPSSHPSASAALAAAAGGSDSLSLPGGRLEIRMVRSAFLEEEFELYVRYQAAQHGDNPSELSRNSYTRFLVDSPLRHIPRQEDPSAPDCGYGSFHQQYWLDGKLIAVGVVDILPRCLSSVYLFWDTSLPSLALGRFSALQEIRWVQEHMAASPALHYYYMGFYIRTCPKMRYKAEYSPSDLLCPVHKVWVRITPKLLAAIDRSPFLMLSREEGGVCQPNLAAPAGDPAALVPVASTRERVGGQLNVEGAKPERPAERHQEQRPSSVAGLLGREVSSSTTDGNVEDRVGDTLIVLRARTGPIGPMTWETAVSRLKIIQAHYVSEIEEAIRKWRAAVGWTAPSLVYQL